ncbi:macrophage-stimulating protein receptor-like isoform X4 [Tachypleus tridentatus]|uniref:macrophage-stimulating protein receptor-like isoform X4 n=1 Tax=Tachypleus tridentatus TaxID=6853 RepID=UPI003FCF5565
MNKTYDTNDFSKFLKNPNPQHHSITTLHIGLLTGSILIVIVSLVPLITWCIRKRKKYLQWRTSQRTLLDRNNCYVLNNKVICDEVSQTDGYEDSCRKEDIVAFVEEALVMGKCHHRNVLSLIAVTVDQNLQLPIIVFPYMQNGDLQTYLRRIKKEQTQEETTTMKRHLLFALHIANGMQYLAETGYIHRDLATRNCMLDEFWVVKIGDFGLAQKVSVNTSIKTSRQQIMPIRWMAPESLRKGEFSEKSDVWSYGVTVWEILTLAETPYSSLDNSDLLNFLEAGNRLICPETCPEKFDTVIQRCFDGNPDARPTFSQIVQHLEDYLTLTSGYLKLQSLTPIADVCSD